MVSQRGDVPGDRPGDRSEDLHSPRHEMDRLDNIVLAALGEPVEPGFAAHLAACPECQAQLDALTRTADLAREGHHVDTSDHVPSSAVWDSIAAELGLENPGVEGGGGARCVRSLPRRPRPIVRPARGHAGPALGRWLRQPPYSP